MKKILAFLTAFLLLFALCGCGNAPQDTGAASAPSAAETNPSASSSNSSADQSSKQSASEPSSPALKIIDGKAEYDGFTKNYITISFKTKNTSGVTITNMFVCFVILDKDGNILSQGEAPGSVRVAPGQGITVEKFIEKPEDAYSAIVDHYTYFISNTEYYTEYVDDSPVVIIP